MGVRFCTFFHAQRGRLTHSVLVTNAQIGKFVREETFWLRANLILFNLMAGWVNYGKWWFGGLGVFERKLNYTTSKTILLFTLPSLSPISMWSGNHSCLLFHNKTIITIMIIRIMIILVTIIGMSIWLGKAFLCAKIQSQKIYFFPLTSQLGSHILVQRNSLWFLLPGACEYLEVMYTHQVWLCTETVKILDSQLNSSKKATKINDI